MPDWSKLTARLAAMLPPAGPLRRYTFISLVDATGTGLFLTASMLFFTRVVGLRAGLVALGLSLAGVVALVGAVPLGSLGDRFGHRRVWVLLTVLEAAVFASYPLVRSFPVFVTLVILAAIAEVGTAPIRGAYLSRIAGPELRVRARAFSQAAYNAGFAIGALGAGVALNAGTTTAYVTLVLADAASFAICAVVVLTLPAAGPVHHAAVVKSLRVLRDLRYLTVSVLNGLMMIYGSVLAVALPLWIVRRTQAPTWTVAAVFLLNTLLAVALQVQVSRGAHTVAGAAAALRRAGLLLLAACLIFASTAMFGAVAAAVVLGLAVVVLTLGELLQSAGAWGLSYELAPEHRQGEYLGAFAMGSRIYDAAGPVVVTGLILGLGGPGWLLLGLLFLILGLGLTPAAHWADRRGK